MNEQVQQLIRLLNFVDPDGNIYSTDERGTVFLRVALRQEQLLPIGRVVEYGNGAAYQKDVRETHKYLYRLTNAWSVSGAVWTACERCSAIIRYLGVEGLYTIKPAEYLGRKQYIHWPGQEWMWAIPIPDWEFQRGVTSLNQRRHAQHA